MSQKFPELEVVRVTVPAAARARHLSAINAEIIRVGRPERSRRRLLAIALATVLLVPVVALAAERSAPGDLLYPVKRVIEPVVQLFDQDVVATHRVDEVERLVARGASDRVLEKPTSDARRVVVDYPELSDRLDRVLDQARAARSEPGEDLAPLTDTTSPAVTDERRTTTTTHPTGSTISPGESDAPSTTSGATDRQDRPS